MKNVKKLLYVYLLAFSVLLCLMACSGLDDDNEEILGRVDENGVLFSPAAINGSVTYLPTMVPESLKIVTLNKQWNPVDSFYVPLDSGNLTGEHVFSTGLLDYEYPMLKIVTVFPFSKKQKMELYQYARLGGYENIKFNVNIYGALAAGRIETLMKKEKFVFDEAEKRAFLELSNLFGKEFSELQHRGFEGLSIKYGTEELNDLVPYIYCRHEISDSVFYSSYKEFRDAFAKNGDDASLKVRAADTWLSTFEIKRDDKNGYLFESLSRDSSLGLSTLNKKFFENAYGISLSVTRYDDVDLSVKIQKKSSDYNGRSFVLDRKGSDRVWRLQSTLEDSIGFCPYRGKKMVKYKKSYYWCKTDSHVWEVTSDRDTILAYTLGYCGTRYPNLGRASYMNDTLFVCSCGEYFDSGECKWKVVKDGLKMESSTTINVDATKRFGECTDTLGERKQMDSLFVQCADRKWVKIDSMTFYMGNCGKNDRKMYGKMPDGQYYRCDAGLWSFSNCADANGYECLWNPTYYKKCGDEYFYCNESSSLWSKVSADSVDKPVLLGDSCGPKNETEIKTYDDEYFVCRGQTVETDSGPVNVNFWQKATDLEVALFKLQKKNKGYCDKGRIGTEIFWDDESGSLYGCMHSRNGTGYELAKMALLKTNKPNQSKYGGGRFINDSTYEVNVDSVTFGFKQSSWNNMPDHSFDKYGGLAVDYVKTEKDSYGIFQQGNHLYIYSKPGVDSVMLLDIKPESESFNDFYEKWYDWVESSNNCNGIAKNRDSTERTTILPFKSVLYHENTYMTYDEAVARCPKGFRLPDTTDMKLMGFFLDENQIGSVRDTYKPNYDKCYSQYEKHLVLFWTGNNKHPGMQYCYGKTLKLDHDYLSSVLECPTDLYPLVQALYLMDW